MKKILLLACCGLCMVTLHAQEAQQQKYSTYYYQRASLFQKLPVTSQDILFVGNSITDGAEWSELFQNAHIKNRGISGDTTYGVYDRLEAILRGKPAKIFLLIGTNNIPKGESAETIVQGIERIVQRIKKESPQTKLYIQSVLPVTPYYNKFEGHTSRWQLIPQINAKIQELALRNRITYIDLFSHFADEQGQMKKEYTNDGLHLLGDGYLLWKEVLTPYINDDKL